MINILQNLRSNRKGGVMVELGLSIPMVFALCMAAGDFARVFYHALTAQGAAGQAAFYGVQTVGQTGDLAGMEQRATDDKGPLGAPTVTAAQWCGCPDGTSFACSEYAVQTCSGYGDPLAYIRVDVQDSFDTMGNYPLIPQNSTIRQVSWMRVR